MSIGLHHERDNVFRMEIRGTLRSRDLARCEEQIVGEIGRLGAVRLLCVLDEFEGWESHDNYNLGFYMKYGDAIERIAIVGEERWRGLAMMFASADLRKAPVEYFSDGAVAEARAWLSQ